MHRFVRGWQYRLYYPWLQQSNVEVVRQNQNQLLEHMGEVEKPFCCERVYSNPNHDVFVV